MTDPLTIIITVGTIFGAIGYGIASFFKGRKSASEDAVKSAQELMAFWKEQADGYRDAMAAKDKENHAKFENLMREIGELKGQLFAAQEQNKRFEEIFQNRNPELDKTLKEILEFMKQIHDHMSGKDLKIETTVSHPDHKPAH